MADGYTQLREDSDIIVHADDLPPDSPIEVVRPRARGEKVSARLATQDGEVTTSNGEPLRYRAGEHFLVDYESGGRAVVRKDIFEKTYRKIGRDTFRKRDNLRLRAAVADADMQISTLEGVKTAHRGDWIMIGVADELWPVPAKEAREKYKSASVIGWTGVGTTIALVFILLLFVTMVVTPQ